MCIIAYTESRPLTDEEFSTCWKNNKDGFGMAWRTKRNGEMYMNFIKGIMEEDEAYEEYYKIRELNVALHFRVATAGGVCPELTHPFVISKESPLILSGKVKNSLLFHNGVITDWKDEILQYFLNSDSGKDVRGKMSDSRWTAISLAMSSPDEDVQLEKLEKIYGKFLFMTPKHVWIVGDWERKDGILFSNSTYEAARYVYPYNNYYGKKKKKHKHWDDFDEEFANSFGFSRGV